MASDELAAAFRGLLLPVDSRAESEAIEALEASLGAAGVEADDQAALLRLDAARWRRGEVMSSTTKRAIAAALHAGAPEISAKLASGVAPTRYLKAHAELQSVRGLSFDEATAFLSHARLIHHLAGGERMSAAQIARLLSAIDTRADFHWQAVEIVLRTLDLRRELDRDAVDRLVESDRAREQAGFADAGVQESAMLVGAIALPLGFPTDLEPLLLRLVTVGLHRHDAYLRILFFQCLVAEFYDHALTVPYEFDPRGKLARRAVLHHLPGLPGAANAFLNNLKAVDRLDLDWARAKKTAERASAEALAEILAGLESMGFAARQELAGWLRRWVLRIERLVQPLIHPVPELPTTAQVIAAITGVSAGETYTSGVIEQRIMDVLARASHDAAVWRAYGLGDSVFATNLHRRKLGDCEFLNAGERHIVAYEAHGGRLTELYVDEHLDTLRRVVELRREELEGIDELSEWFIDVKLVGHELAAATRMENVSGITVTLEPITFGQLADAVDPSGLVDSFVTFVHTPLNERRTPQRARDAYLALIAAI